MGAILRTFFSTSTWYVLGPREQTQQGSERLRSIDHWLATRMNFRRYWGVAHSFLPWANPYWEKGL